MQREKVTDTTKDRKTILRFIRFFLTLMWDLCEFCNFCLGKKKLPNDVTFPSNKRLFILSTYNTNVTLVKISFVFGNFLLKFRKKIVLKWHLIITSSLEFKFKFMVILIKWSVFTSQKWITEDVFFFFNQQLWNNGVCRAAAASCCSHMKSGSIKSFNKFSWTFRFYFVWYSKRESDVSQRVDRLAWTKREDNKNMQIRVKKPRESLKASVLLRTSEDSWDSEKSTVLLLFVIFFLI